MNGKELRVYYDDACPLCREEIMALKAADVDDRLILKDCSAANFEDAEAKRANLGKADLMQAMHVCDSDGNWYRGPDAFARIYAAAGIPWMARLWGSRTLKPLWNRIYPWIARHRQQLSRSALPWAVRHIIGRAARARPPGS